MAASLLLAPPNFQLAYLVGPIAVRDEIAVFEGVGPGIGIFGWYDARAQTRRKRKTRASPLNLVLDDLPGELESEGKSLENARNVAIVLDGFGTEDAERA